MAQPKPRFGGAHSMENITPPSERFAMEGGNSLLGGGWIAENSCFPIEHTKRIENDVAITEFRELDIQSGELLFSENGSLPSEGCGAVSDLVPEVEKLLKVFRELGINAPPKPYKMGSVSRTGVTADEMAAAIVRSNEGMVPLPAISCDDLQDVHECHGVKPQETEASLEENKVITSKNLFLKDRKGQFYLVIMEEGMAVDLKNLKVLLNASRNLSFADQGSLQSILGVQPGGVTPLAMMRDTARGVRLVISDQLVKSAKRPGIKLAFHPLDAALQVEMSFSELTAFLLNFGHQLEVLKLNDRAVDESKKGENLKQGKKKHAGKFDAKPVQAMEKGRGAVREKASMLAVESSSASTSVSDCGNELDYISEFQSTSEIEIASKKAQTDVKMNSITVMKSKDFVMTESTIKTESGSDFERECHMASGIQFEAAEGDCDIEPAKVSKTEITSHPPSVVNVEGGEPEWNVEVNWVKYTLCDLGESCSIHSDGSARKTSKDRLLENPSVGENSQTCKHKQSSESNITHMQPPQAEGRKEESGEVMDVDSTRQNSDFEYKKLKYLTSKVFDRKGKLKSFLKKKNSPKSSQNPAANETDSARCAQTASSIHCNSSTLISSSHSTGNGVVDALSKQSGGTQHMVHLADPGNYYHDDAVAHLYDRPLKDDLELKVCVTASSAEHNKARQGAEMLRLKPSKLLPEVEEFYSSLVTSGALYNEFDLSCSDSQSMGPSIGCKTLLLKDKGQNFFLIITHEFYELDYGRLRNAIKPKKKLQIPGDDDVMAALGVDPSRMTPFALLNQRAKDVRVYLTQKILPGKIVLSIQHPFASGYRILMTSSALQAYLDNLGIRYESVQEKTWSAKYNTIFTRFESMPDVGDTYAQGGEAMSSSNQLPRSNLELKGSNISSDKMPIEDNIRNVGERPDRDVPLENREHIDSSSFRKYAIAKSTTFSSRRSDIWEFFKSWMPRVPYFQQGFFHKKDKEVFTLTSAVSQSLVGVDGSSVDPWVGEGRKSLVVVTPRSSLGRVNARPEGLPLSVQSQAKCVSELIPPALLPPLGIEKNHESVSQTVPPHDATGHIVGEGGGSNGEVSKIFPALSKFGLLESRNFN